MKICKLVCKKVFIIISCMCLFFSVPMSVFASDDNKLNVYFGVSGASSINVPVAPMSVVYGSGSTGYNYGAYSGVATVDFYLYPEIRPSVMYLNGWIGVSSTFNILDSFINPGNQSFTVHYRASISEVSLMDEYGNVYSGSSYSAPYFGQKIFPPNTSSNGSDSITLTAFVRCYDIVLNPSFTVRVKYDIYCDRPITALSFSSCSMLRHDTYDISFSPSGEGNFNVVSKLDSLENKTDITNNKLDNLTSGFDQSGIDSTNQQLGNNLDSFDQAEDAAIDSVKDYFNDIDQPIDFFNVGSFLISNTFI